MICYGTPNYAPAIAALKESARPYFDRIIAFGPDDLPEEFKTKHAKILSAPRGAGYWLWKPKIIDMTMEISNYGDFVFYIDAGNVIIGDINPLFDRCINSDGILLFDNRDGTPDGSCHLNKTWTKRKAFHLMDFDYDTFYNAPQVDASYQLYQKGISSLKFIELYLHYCSIPEIIMDDEMPDPMNLTGFRDHRHDQSVLSMLAKSWRVPLEIEPSEWGNNCPIRKWGQLFYHHRRPDYHA